MMTKDGDIDAGHFGGIDQAGSLRSRNLFSVDG
jgi:hypothetical protein